MFKSAFFALATIATSAFAYQGDATWYHTGLGACGAWSADTDLVVALNPTEYANGAHCWQHISVWYGDKWTDATVVDLCPGCGPQGIDLSPGAFSNLADLGAGRISVSWAWA